MKRLLILSYSVIAVVFILPLILLLAPAADADEPLTTGAPFVSDVPSAEASPSAEVSLSPSSAPSPSPDLWLLEPLAPLAAAPAAGIDDTEETPELSLDSDVTLRLVTSTGVITITLADYLPRAVAAEMPPSFGEEALKAQAVAARTFAYRSMINARSGTGKHSNGDLCTSASCCMSYKKAVDDLVAAAVADTDGIVMLSDGTPIIAAFHASAGGKTRDAQAVWGGYISYLTAVDSPDTDIGARGHGVGMSQYGAKALAESGSTFEEILLHYYTGTTLSGYAISR